MELVKKEKEPRLFARYLRYKDTRQPFGLVIYDGVNFGWSLCGPKDHFERRKAWMVARNRLSTGRDYLEELNVSVEEQQNYSRRGSFLVEGLPYRYTSKIEALSDVMLYLAAGSDAAARIMARSKAGFDQAVERLR